MTRLPIIVCLLSALSFSEQNKNVQDVNIIDSIIIKLPKKNNHTKEINSTERIKINNSLVIGNIGNQIGN